MSYENAPATKMLATTCACCGRPLVDAKSVECGVGPDCRKKYGYDVDCGEEARIAANMLVHQIACDPRSVDTLHRCDALEALGFGKLASTIRERTAAIVITGTQEELLVSTPFNEAFVAEVRGIPGRRWHKEQKLWAVPSTQRAALWTALRHHYVNALGVGPKGPFVVA